MCGIAGIVTSAPADPDGPNRAGEILLHGYEEWGFEGLLQRIDGMFAFALWDERKQELFLARDRVGKKPLYYAPTRDGGLAFASTLSALLELLPDRPGIDPVALD